MDFTTTERIESKVLPGIAFVLVKLTEGRRIELRRMGFDITMKIRPLMKSVGELHERLSKLMPKPGPEGEIPALAENVQAECAEIEDRVAELFERISFLTETEMEPMWIQWALLSIEGDLTIEGQPASKQNIANGPPELYREIIGAIRVALGLSEPQIKNSSSPTTSNVPEGGTTGDTTATSAGNPTSASTEPATVVSISPAA